MCVYLQIELGKEWRRIYIYTHTHSYIYKPADLMNTARSGVSRLQEEGLEGGGGGGRGGGGGERGLARNRNENAWFRLPPKKRERRGRATV